VSSVFVLGFLLVSACAILVYNSAVICVHNFLSLYQH
jgi:hypothetical protein